MLARPIDKWICACASVLRRLHEATVSQRVRHVLVAALASLLVASCTRLAPSSDAPGAAAPTDNAWHAELSVSGGFAGIDEGYRLDYQAQTLTASNSRRGRTATRQLTRAQLAELTSMRATFAHEPASKPIDSRCADCIRYVLSITDRADVHRSTYDSTTLPGSRDAALIHRLIELGRESLAEQTN